MSSIENIAENSINRIDKINSYYEKNFAELEKIYDVLDKEAAKNINAQNYKILGWESRQAQYTRFAAFTKNVDLKNKSLLDVGCGLGDLFHFITSGLGISVKYVGIDISSRMIETAKKQLEILKANGLKLEPSNVSTVEFLQADLFYKNFNGRYDWIYASGIFNLNLGNNQEFLENAFKKFALLKKDGFACSMLNQRSQDKEEPYYYYNPSDVKNLAQSVGAKSVQIIDDYLENDFTLIARF